MFPEIFSIDNVPIVGTITIHSYGLMVALAFLIGGFLLEKEFIRIGRNRELAGSLIIYTIIGSIVGAKIYFLIQNPRLVQEDFFGNVFSGAGLIFYGGAMGAAFAVAIWARKNEIPYLLAVDLMAPMILLGHGIGRIGCFLSGDGCYGPPSDVPWAMTFPNGVVPTLESVHPTPLYDTIILTILFFVLWSVRKKNYKQGTYFGLFAIFMGVERFLTEFWRTDPKYIFGLISEAQTISILLFIVGLSLILFVNRNPKES